MNRLAQARVLVIEDDPDLRWLTQSLLEEVGALVTCAASAREALERVREFRPHVAVVDGRLPDSSGLRLSDELRRQAPACRQVMVSGDVRAVADWTRLGGLALGKPYELPALIALVEHAVLAQRGAGGVATPEVRGRALAVA